MTWAPDYVTTAVIKNYLNIEDTRDDYFIGKWITTVSRNVDDHCGRQFGQTAGLETRYYPTFYDRGECAWFANIDDIQDVTALTFTTEAAVLVDAADYRLLPRNAAVKGRPYETLKLTSWAGGELTANGKWGWSAQPAAVDEGMFLQAARLAARRDSPFGISGSPSEQGELRLLAQLDPDFRTSLRPYVREWWAA